jgi:hypothetical protein
MFTERERDIELHFSLLLSKWKIFIYFIYFLYEVNTTDKRLKRRNMDMRFGKWNLRRLYRAGYLMTVSRNYTDIG